MNTQNHPRPSRPLVANVFGAVVVAAVLLGWPLAASAADQIVTTTADAGAGSLRQAIADATDGDSITFAPGLDGATITLYHSLIIDKSLSIDASALTGGITVSGNNASRVFQIAIGRTNTMKHLTITGGNAINGGGISNVGNLTLDNISLVDNFSSFRGGAIDNPSLGTLTIINSTLSGNTSSATGGAINSEGSLSLTNCTLSGNISGEVGGGISAIAGSLNLINCTLVGNVATNSGGGFFAQSGVTIMNSIVAGNSASSGTSPDIRRSGTPTFIISGTNLIGDNSGVTFQFPAGPLVGTSASPLDPLLAPLGDYGGPTQTMPPLPGSPAMDAASSGPATDQRGIARPQGASYDLGAVETRTTGECFAVVVSSTDDSGPGTLRQALVDVCPGGIILFDPTLDGSTITLTSGQLLLNKSLSIDASALPGGITVSGNNASQVFAIGSGANVTLDSLAIANGRTTGRGGAISCSGTLTIRNSTLHDNTAGDVGGAICNETTGTVVLLNSTLTRNTADGTSGQPYGGAIFNFATLSLIHCTVTGNNAPVTGGGLRSQSGTITIENTIIAGNTSSVASPDISKSSVGGTIIIPQGANLIGDNNSVTDDFPADGVLVGGDTFPVVNPLLAPLGYYGGPTQTMPPLAGSPAIDGCTNGTSFLTDQRGFPRVVGAFADIGAVEGIYNPPGPVKWTGITRLGDGSIQIGFTKPSGMTHTVLASTDLALPFNLWSNLGPALETPSGSSQFQFTDSQAPNFPRRFYVIEASDPNMVTVQGGTLATSNALNGTNGVEN